MKGLDLARGYYEEYGRPMLEEGFPELLPFLAVGFTGSGSEHYGYDDETSRDHDFEPGFCIFLPGEDVVGRRQAFLLERAYAKLPGEYLGFRRQPLSPVGGNRNGVHRTEEYYAAALGAPDGVLSTEGWLHIPDYALAEAVNGEIWTDNYGQVTEIRRRLEQMPRDVKYKRMAGNLLLMAQSGQYNYLRCLSHGEPEAAELACREFVTAAMKVLFLLNDRYMPFYKWSFRALRELETGRELVPLLSRLLLGDPGDWKEKYHAVEEISSRIITELQNRHMTRATCGDLEKHAYSLNDGIRDPEIRNMHILTGI